MRILFLAHQFFPEHYAGTEVLTLGLAHELKTRGHEPHILAAKRSRPIHEFDPYEVEDYVYEGIPVRRVGRPSEVPPIDRRLEYDNERMATLAGRYAQEVSPDVVHVMHMQGLGVGVLQEFEAMGLPMVYTATDFWAICPVVDMKRHDGKMCLGPEVHHCVRCIASRQPRSPLERSLRGKSSKMLRVASRLPGNVIGKVLRQPEDVAAVRDRPGYISEKLEGVDHVIAPTKLMKRLLVANGAAEESKIEVSHYGVDTRDIDDIGHSREHPGDGALKIGFMGTLNSHKGCDTLIKAFRKLPRTMDTTLTIYGNLNKFASFVEKLRALAEGDDRITLAGTFQPDTIGEVFSGLDVLVVPSRWYENTPLVLYSAFAAGVPVVATNLGGMSEVVEDGKNGLLFDLDDDAGLVRQLQRLGEEEGLLGKLRSGIGPVKTIGENAGELESLYERLLSSR